MSTTTKAISTTIGTHSGVFHCDEVLACFLLRQLPEYEHAKILRSRDDSELKEKCDIIVDVGGVFDHAQKLYDHHQKSFFETLSSLRPELGDEFDIRLSSAGLVYTYYGEAVITNILQRQFKRTLTPSDLDLIYKKVYKGFIMEIDAIDNGVPMFDGEPKYNISTGISSRVKRLNPSWREVGVGVEDRFHKAIELVGAEFTQTVLSLVTEWLDARVHVQQALESAKSIYPTGEILILETLCPWQAHLDALEKEYNVTGVPKLVLYNGSDGSWRIQGVPQTPDSYVGRKFFPASWRGLRDEKLCAEAGLPNLKFVHYNGFIGGADSKEAAIAMAIKSLETPGAN